MAGVVLVGLISGSHSGKAELKQQIVISRDLYGMNRLFCKALSYSETVYDKTYILSALYGLLEPFDNVPYYDRDLRYFTVAERSEWAAKVYSQCLTRGLFEANVIVFWHTARPYYDGLTAMWDDDKQQSPLKGLGQGQQMAWYKNQGF